MKDVDKEEVEDVGGSMDTDDGEWVSHKKTRTDIKKEWDHLVEQKELEYGVLPSSRNTYTVEGRSLYNWQV